MSGIGSRSAPTYNIPAPANYVAGVGRGAIGFTTRSDIGPARSDPFSVPTQFGAPPAGYVAGRGRGMGELARSQGEGPPPSASAAGSGEPVDTGDYSESNYDEFSGYSERLFASSTYDQEDREADQIYGAVDDVMENRRKRIREKQLLNEDKRARTERPRIADQFVDLKRELSRVTDEEWDSIPDVGDHTLKYKQSKKKEFFSPLPDSILASSGGLRSNSFQNSADMTVDGTTFSSSSAANSLVSGGRGTVMSNQLDKVSDSVSGQTVVDPQGYITSLNSIKISTSTEIGDIKKARVLLQSVTTTNPKHGPGWIAAARVEEYANKISLARKVILKGCEACSDSEDVWLEAARLHPNDTAKVILANAVKNIPTSVKIWMKAAELEATEIRRKEVLRRSLEFIPNSVQLWKAAVELENVTDARIMLARAVECVPSSVDMWLALAKLETHENARKVLNQAREAIPTDRLIWITAAKLEEAHSNLSLVKKIIAKMVESLTQYQVVIKREEWMQDAIDCEKCGAKVTCEEIIRHTIAQGVDYEDRKKTWMDDADYCLTLENSAIITARAILRYATEVFPSKKSIWQQYAMLEKEYGNSESLDDVLIKGVQNCPQAEILWLMAAKEKWIGGKVADARTILLEAFKANPKSEQIWLAAVKLEWENDEFVRARLLLERARTHASSDRIWLKSALLEQEMGEYGQAINLLDEGIRLFPAFSKLYMMAGQVQDENFHNAIKAREYYTKGLHAVRTSITLWLLLMRLEEKSKGFVKARSIGEIARGKFPNNDLIWLECIRLEKRSMNEKLSDNLMAQALRNCPSSGLLWSEILLSCPKAQQKAKAIDALKKCGKSPHVALALARLFEKCARKQKAWKWFERAIALEPRLGDSWVYYFVFQYVELYRNQLLGAGLNIADNNNASSNDNETVELDGVDDPDGGEEQEIHYSQDQAISVLKSLIKQCEDAGPNMGELWCPFAKQVNMRRKKPALILVGLAESVLGFSVKKEGLIY